MELALVPPFLHAFQAAPVPVSVSHWGSHQPISLCFFALFISVPIPFPTPIYLNLSPSSSPLPHLGHPAVWPVITQKKADIQLCTSIFLKTHNIWLQKISHIFKQSFKSFQMSPTSLGCNISEGATVIINYQLKHMQCVKHVYVLSKIS